METEYIYKKVLEKCPLVDKKFINDIIEYLGIKKLKILGTENTIDIINNYLSNSKKIAHIDCKAVKHLEKIIGSGAEGVVYCSDETCSYAIKVMGSESKEMTNDIYKSIKKQKKLYKLGISPKIYDYKICDNLKKLPTKNYNPKFKEFIVVMMDVINGSRFGKIINNRIIKQLFTYLKIMQVENISHGDIAIQNIMYDENKDRIYLIDPAPNKYKPFEDFVALLFIFIWRSDIDKNYLMKQIRGFAKFSIDDSVCPKASAKIIEYIDNNDIESLKNYLYSLL